MKKVAVILVITFFTTLFVSACNEKSCPAYTSSDTSQTENNG